MAKPCPPQYDELEFSLFGAGVGECCVLHLGAGNWMVVDSCMNATGDKPVALEYLEGLGVDVTGQVKRVVVTHWHDDHIRGVAALFRRAAGARFACSAALRSQEFFALIETSRSIRPVEHMPGAAEFGEILALLDARAGGSFRAGPDLWLQEGTCLYSESTPFRVEVHALSPSPQTVTDAIGGLARLMPHAGEPIRRFHSTGPNDLSVALVVTAAGRSLLLGGDLVTGGDQRRGWRAVVGSSQRPRVNGNVYKVAHHGSENADLNDIWTDLLVVNPWALLTPYARGARPLPSDADVLRIKSRTIHLYSTVWPSTKSPPYRDNAVDRTMREVARFRRATRKHPGHICVRMPITRSPEDISVGLFDGAQQL